MHITLIFVLSITVPALSSRILYLGLINASSHIMWNTALATELAERGHQVTYISSKYLKGEFPKNMKVVSFKRTLEQERLWNNLIIDGLDGNPSTLATTLQYVPMKECEEIFDSQAYHDLISPSNKDTYDLIVIEHYGHDCLFALSHRFGSAPIVLTCPSTYNPYWIYRLMGVPLFHAATHAAESSKPRFDFWRRVESLIVYLLNDFDYYTRARPSMDKAINQYFGGDVPPLEKLTDNIALALVNTPDWMDKTPLTTNVKSIAGIHLTESKNITQEKLVEFVKGADNGIILVSFGTLMPTQLIATDIFQAIASAVGRLPQRVIWKWDTQRDHANITFPDNVFRLPWVPQNDLLGHPKIRLFVSHCGGQGTLEAAFHGVPILAIPGFWSQFEMANGIAAVGLGIRLDFKDITADSVFETSSELLNNPKYFLCAQRLKASMRNPLVKPLDAAMFWFEYVIHHRGAALLRPLMKDLPHRYTLLADFVVVLTASVVLLFSFLILLFFSCRFVKLFPNRGPPSKKKIQ